MIDRTSFDGMSVIRISRSDAIPFIMSKHYARRIPSISHAFGLMDGSSLVGIVTYGTPASHTLLKGVAGDKYARIVIELNRLTCKNVKNYASFLVARSLRMLPKPSIVVSYADSGVGHVGFVYQACNFIYTGMSAPWTDPVVKGKEHQHHASYARGKSNEELKLLFGDDLSWKQRTAKHRYVFVCADRRNRTEIERSIRYKRIEYPKGETKRHSVAPADIQTFLFSSSTEETNH